MANIWKSDRKSREFFYGWDISQALLYELPKQALRERSALLRVFGICQQVVGGWEPTFEVLGLPSQPLDISLLMRMVLRTFTLWADDSLPEELLQIGRRPIFVEVDKAFAYYEQIKVPSIRNGLLRFLKAVELDSDLPTGHVDLSYCFQILGNFVFEPKWLNLILTGEIARSADYLDENDDAWFDSWIVPT